jgi:hypothetical protein
MPDPYSSVLNSLLSALVGAAVVYYYGIRRDSKQRRFAFLEKQLGEFHAPLAGLQKQIRAKSELRLKIQTLTGWDDPKTEAIVDYHNKQFHEDLLPKYREMLSLFTERYHLANSETRAFYQEFLEFVEVWNMWVAKSLPPDAPKKLDHREEKVKPFYDHLHAMVGHLQDEIARG